MKIGEFQTLTVVRDSPHGLLLTDGDNDILLPNKESPAGAQIGDKIDVFVLTDSEDRPIATRQEPWAQVGDFAKLPVISRTKDGAFLAWGLDKDLFCPIREQRRPLAEGEDVLVRIYLDEVSNRIACTTKLNRFLAATDPELQVGARVSILISYISEDFIEAIIEGRVTGTLFPDEWHEHLEIGETRDAYIKQVRDDGKIALSLRPQGYRAVIGERDRILDALRANRGFLPVSDRSSPQEIHRRFGLSKGAFKKLLGALYKEGIIEIEAKSIRLRIDR